MCIVLYGINWREILSQAYHFYKKQDIQSSFPKEKAAVYDIECIIYHVVAAESTMSDV